MKSIKLSFFAAALASSFLFASEGNSDNLPNFEETGKWSAFPFAFTSDTTGFAGGGAVISQGLFQPQTTFVAALSFGVEQDIITNGIDRTDNFSLGFLSYSDIKIPHTTGLFLSMWGMFSHYPKDVIYLDGSNDSDDEDGLVTADDQNFLTIKLKYVLPIGEGLENPDGIYELRNGFAMDRENFGDGIPFETGRTDVGLVGFYQYQTIENWKETLPWKLSTMMPEWNDSGLRFYLNHDNTDFDLNPSRGYSFFFQYSSDYGWGDNLQEWENIEFKASKYFNLETLSFTQQNVLALNFWTAYSPSWENDKEILPGLATGRPPLWEGARLGGFSRMRGYDSNRFSDKAAIYGAAEYRAMLKWNPFKEEGWLKDNMPVDVDWLQAVGFIEAGRVNENYDFDLLSDMKFDAGVSLRAMVAELPVRFDIAYSEEGVGIWAMIRQPFDF
jgi:hypothetical protein